MKRRTLRLALVAAGACVLVAALAIGGAWWLVSTGSGARFALDRLDPVVPGELRLGRVDGPLRGPLRVEELVWERDGMTLSIGELRLTWRLRELLHRRLDVESLAAERVRMTMTPGEDTGEPFALPQIELPVVVIVRQATLDDAVIAIGEARPIVVRSAALATHTRGEQVAIERFELDSPDLGLEVEGAVTPIGDYAVDLDVAWSLRAADGKVYRGAGTLDGTLEDLRVRQRLDQPFAARVDARLLQPLDDLRVDGDLAASGIDLADLDPEWPAATVGGELHASGSLEDLRLDGTVSADTADYGPLSARLAVRGGGERWRIERLRLEPASGDAAGRPVLHAQGDLTLGEAPRFDLEARWEALRWPLDSSAAAVALAPSGAIAARGTLDRFRLDAQARVGVPGLAATAASADAARAPLWVDAEIAASGGRTSIEIERFVGRTLGGVVSGEGEVVWSPAVSWRLALDGDGLRPATLDPRIEGELDLAASTAGAMRASGPQGTIVLTRLDGTLRGGPVRGRGRIDLRGDDYRVRALDLRWGDARLEAAGVVGAAIDLDFRLDAPDLAKLHPDWNGALEAEGELGGTRESPGLRATARGERLVLAGLAADTLEATATVGQRAEDPFDVELAAGSLRWAERAFDGVRLSARGTRAAHTFEARLAGGAAPLESLVLQARGGLVGKEWRGEARQATLELEAGETWSLASPAAVIVGPERIHADELCLESDGSTLCARADLRGADSWTVEATAREVALGRLTRLYRPDLDVDGTIAGSLVASAAGAGKLRARAVVTSSRGTFALPTEYGTDAGRGEWRDATLRLDAGDRGTRAEAEAHFVNIGSIEGWLELPGWSAPAMPPATQPLRGELEAAASSLEPLGLFTDAFARPRGRLDADLIVAGTVGDPRVTGQATLRDGSAFVVPLGIDVAQVGITATPDASGRLALAGSLRSGDGTLRLQGSAPLDPRDTLLRVELAGEDVLIMDLPDRRIVATTDEIGVRWAAEGIEVGGEVRIPEALLLLGEDSPDAVSASTDVVFVRLPAGEVREAADELALRARVRILLGEEVIVSGLGLDAEVRGSLLVIGEPGSATHATGELDLSGGTFSAYGQKLDLERGRLIFANSPVTSPALDLRASRTTGDVVAGIDARGTLANPRVTLWSEPSMQQAEQLSYLLLGRPLNDASPEDGDVLASAARSLGLRGGRYLAGRLGTMFGLEEARIDTTGGFEQASLVLGKFLSPRLYVSYGVGLFEGANTLLIRYLLSKKLTLEASTGEHSSADVLYVREFGPGEARPELAPGLPGARDKARREAIERQRARADS
jgi:translocation and assembly module TamB